MNGDIKVAPEQLANSATWPSAHVDLAHAEDVVKIEPELAKPEPEPAPSPAPTSPPPPSKPQSPEPLPPWSPQQPKTKTKNWLWVALAIAAIILVAGLAFWLGMPKDNEIAAPPVIPAEPTTPQEPVEPSPQEPIVPPVEEPEPILVSVSSLSTEDTTPLVSGTVSDPDSDLTVTVDGFDYPATVRGDGTWSAIVSRELKPGDYNVSAVAENSETTGQNTTANELSITEPVEEETEPELTTPGPDEDNSKK